MMMTSTVPCAVILLASVLTFSSAQTSCRGRCGAEYYRGYTCQCDYTCLSYGECCRDYESQCTTKNSCKGRCGETFKRGRHCSCDPECINYNQCCPDYKAHCDEEEEISGAASTTVPVKTSSCDNANANKPKEPTLNEATEQLSPFSEGNDADDYSDPLVDPTSYPPDDPTDDTYSKILPYGEFSNNGEEEAGPIPEGTSDYGPSTAEPSLMPDALEPTAETSTVFSQPEMTPSNNEPTQADDTDNPPSLPVTSAEAPTESTDASDPIDASQPGTTLPQPTSLVDLVSSQPATTSAPEAGVSPTSSTPKLETGEQAEVQPEGDNFPVAQKTDPTVASSDKPDLTTQPSNTLASISTGPSEDYIVPEKSQVTTTTIPTTSASSAMDPTSIPDATTSNPEPDDTGNNSEDATAVPPSVPADLQDPSTSASQAEPETVPGTTHVPPSKAAVQEHQPDEVTPQVTTADPVKVTPDLTEPQKSEATSKPQSKAEPFKPLPTKPTLAKPTSKPVTKPLATAQTLSIDDQRDYQADDSNDTNLCSGRPVSGITTLRNGTMVVFRGHFFWVLDRNRVPGPAQGITSIWGVPSPIDTVFTRCNCQGKTYIFKGNRYWRFENNVLDTGYPKVIATGFDGLRGHITAALSVPQYRTRSESVYFFKRGGLVQKYSYQFGTRPTCGKKVQDTFYPAHNRKARQAVSNLTPPINIRLSWRGFPSTVTAAVSIPTNTEPDGYKYYVFSRSKSYNLRMDFQRPVIAPPKANTSPQSDNLFKCPKKV